MISVNVSSIIFIISWIFMFNSGFSPLFENDEILKDSLFKKIEVVFNFDIVKINRDVRVEEYFEYLDSLVLSYDSKVPYKLTEHLLVHANSWIIDSLVNTDYYRMKERDSFVYNQKKLVVLRKGQDLIIPDSTNAKKTVTSLNNILIDVNIPEFKLRIYENAKLLYTFPVRVGRNKKKYLKMSNRITNLKTKTGNGQIIAHVKKPNHYNPVNGKQYYVTTRDDEKVTIMPQIPWIETELDGMRYGQLIHPTTNPKTLGKAYSNGCIGTKEADAWIIYYYAPIGAKVSIRYDLKILDTNTNTNNNAIILKDIYK